MQIKTLFTAGALFAAALLTGTDDARAETAWAPESINRPLTMPAGSFYAGASFNSLLAFDALAAGVQGGYGISDELEVTASYLYLIDPSNAGGFRVGAGYAAVRGAMDGKLEIIPRAEVGYGLDPGAITPLVVGLQLQYTLAPKMAIVMPASHLTVTLDGDPKPITFGVPVGFLFQAAPAFYAQVDTTLATISIADSETVFIGADTTPLTLTGAYNSQTLDVGASIGTDLSNSPADVWALTVFARFYGGV